MDYKYKLDYQKLAERIKEARKVKGITQAELAERIDVTTNTIAKLETNYTTVSLQTLINIANELDTDINYFIFDEYGKDVQNTSIDVFFESLLKEMGQKEKELLINMYNAVKIYKS